ncbi:MAG: lipid-A-disaccharide synthase [Deltaproteobacteria bacterium]|nr:lipid-A-disaccharide synthase [Deltaproteobacteria bacterium]
MAASLDILIVAGEASGDAHAGALMRELSGRLPRARFFGMGGVHMREAGLEALFDAREISVMGLVEVLPKLWRILQVLRSLTRAAEERLPRLAILVDVPDFNLRLAKRLKRLGIPVVYYISPMVWATREGRVKQIARDVDTVLCILPFEEAFLRERGVSARYVGSPVLEHAPAPAPASVFRERLGLDPGATTLAVLPGSRESELTRLMPTLVAAAERVARARPGLQVVVPVAPTLEKARVAAYFEKGPLCPRLVDGRAAEAVGASDAAIVCSGTATLEAALMLRPLVVVYRVSWLTGLLVRMLARIAHVSLVNLLAGRRLVPELLQSECTAERIAEVTLRYLDDEQERTSVVEGLMQVRASLGAPGASAQAAEAVVSLLRRLDEAPAGARTVEVPTSPSLIP